MKHRGSFSVNTLFGVCELTGLGAGVERLTKKKLCTLLEFIKECYSIRDRETFAHRVSRLAEIVSIERSRGVNAGMTGHGAKVKLLDLGKSSLKEVKLLSWSTGISLLFTPRRGKMITSTSSPLI
jgi:hypothetical protein